MPMKFKQYIPWLFVCITFSALAVAIYWPARNGLWEFDDAPNILHNILLRDFSESYRFLMGARGVSYFSFALDYKFWGLDPASFRWVNVVIHTINSLLVVLLLRQLIGSIWRWAIVGGLFFLCHPIQTSAVSYIVQRMTLLSTFFALLAILLVDRYLLFTREGQYRWARICLIMSTLCGILSVMSKENTFLLPFVIPLLAWLREKGRLDKGWHPAFFCWLSICAIAILLQHITGGSTVERLTGVPLFKDTGNVLYEPMGEQDRVFLPIRYLLSQLEVFWVYLRLIFFPIRQVLDYSWPIPDFHLSLLHLVTFILISSTFFFVYKYRTRNPFLFIGLLWITIFVVIESSFIPLDPIFEHRIYLPLVGVIFIFHDLGKLCPKKVSFFIVILALGFLSFLAWKRNLLWGDHFSFWQSNVQIIGHAPRPLNTYMLALFTQNRFVEAAEIAKILNSQKFIGDIDMGEALFFSGETEKAMNLLLNAVKRGEVRTNRIELLNAYNAIQEKKYAEANDFLNQADLYNVKDTRGFYFRGLLAEAQNDPFTAIENYLKAARTNESNSSVFLMGFDNAYATWASERRSVLLNRLSKLLDQERAKVKSAENKIQIRGNFANTLTRLGLYQEALTHYLEIKKVAPNLWSLYYNLGMLYEKLGWLADAEESYKTSYKLSPNYIDNTYNYVVILIKRRKFSIAQEVLQPLLKLNPEDARYLLLSGDLLSAKDDIAGAREVYMRVSLLPGYQSRALSRLYELNIKLGAKK